MLFKRRKPPGWGEYLRVWLWPRRSWLRSGQYVTKRVLRLTATPHAISAGVAAGAFTSFTPFLGFHFIIAALLAWLVRGNLIASALGTFVGNPLTFPFIWFSTLSLGKWLTGHGNTAVADVAGLTSSMKEVVEAAWSLDGTQTLAALNHIWEPLLFPMFIGGIPLGLLCGGFFYFLTRRAAAIFRESRRNKLMAKAAQIRDRAKRAAGESAMNNATGRTETPS